MWALLSHFRSTGMFSGDNDSDGSSDYNPNALDTEDADDDADSEMEWMGGGDDSSSAGGNSGRRGSGGGGGAAAVCGKRSLSRAGDGELDAYATELDALICRDVAAWPEARSAQQQRTGLPGKFLRRARGELGGGRGSDSSKFCAAAGQGFLPGHPGARLGPYEDKLFCGKFSVSGDVFLSAAQDAQIRLFRASDLYQYTLKGEVRDGSENTPPPAPVQPRHRARRGGGGGGPAEQGRPRPYKTIVCRDVGWAVVGTDFSPDDQWLAYSSWSQYVHLCNVQGDYEMHEALDFQSPERGAYSFCLFSIRFSPTNTHLLAGGSDHAVHLYNLERKEVVARLKAHADDVNAVCYLDDGGNVLLSGSDDCSIRVWDIRSSKTKPVGTLCGHDGGITCVSARADGRTVASNSKDQTLKLWDARAMAGPGSAVARLPTRQSSWDYRWDIPAAMRAVSAAAAAASSKRRGGRSCTQGVDQSLKTFSGHRVLQTLIRCNFSPMHTTGQRYIVSGSQCGGVHMWDVLTGRPLQRHPQAHRPNIRRRRYLADADDEDDAASAAAQQQQQAPAAAGAAWEPPEQAPLHHDAVRDVSWHPHLPLLASSSWDCSVGLWTYKRGACANVIW